MVAQRKLYLIMLNEILLLFSTYLSNLISFTLDILISITENAKNLKNAFKLREVYNIIVICSIQYV